MARSNELIKASVFEDTKNAKRICQGDVKDMETQGGFITASPIIHSCEHIAIRFGNVKPL
jgi:hypothetical protein